MSPNSKKTSQRIASIASAALQNTNTSDIAKRLAGSALAQTGNGRQTGPELEDLASRVLRSDKYANSTKELAASVLAQSNKSR